MAQPCVGLAGLSPPCAGTKGPLPWQQQRDRQRQGREAALVPVASGGAPGGTPGSGAEPRAEQGPSFAVPGDSSEMLCERTQQWSGSR